MARDANRGVLPHAWIAAIGLLILLERAAFAPAQHWAGIFPNVQTFASIADWAGSTERQREIFLTLFVLFGLVGLWWRGAGTLRIAGAPLYIGWVLVPAASILLSSLLLWHHSALVRPAHWAALALACFFAGLIWVVSGGRLGWAVVGTLYAIVCIARHAMEVTASPESVRSLWADAVAITSVLAAVFAGAVALAEGLRNRRRLRVRMITLMLALVAAILWFLSLQREGVAWVIVTRVLGYQGGTFALVHACALFFFLVAVCELIHRRRLRWALWPLAALFFAGAQIGLLSQLAALWALLAWIIVFGWAEDTGSSDALLPAYLS